MFTREEGAQECDEHLRLHCYDIGKIWPGRFIREMDYPS